VGASLLAIAVSHSTSSLNVHPPSPAGWLPQVFYFFRAMASCRDSGANWRRLFLRISIRSCRHSRKTIHPHKSIVGASLLAIAVSHSTSSLNVHPPSPAGWLPQGFYFFRAMASGRDSGAHGSRLLLRNLYPQLQAFAQNHPST
jgi:hypothetical protein